MTIDNKFSIGQTVYFVNDREWKPLLVTAIQVLPGGLLYRVANLASESWHYTFELTADKPIPQRPSFKVTD